MMVNNNDIDKEKIARDNILRESEEVSGVTVRGYDFNQGVDYDKIIDAYASSAGQATQFAKAIETVKEMRKNNAFIYLGFTSNLVTGGLREVIRYLVEHKLVDVLVTTAGAVEEDIIKCMGDFKLGDFSLSGKTLRDGGINRAGNVLVPNSRYCRFEEFMLPLLQEELQLQGKGGYVTTPSRLVHKMGEKVAHEDSICYWAAKNKIPLFCPAPTDGAWGDVVYFFKSNNASFQYDISSDIVELNNSTIGKDKTGVIILGAGVVKHHILNANMFRNGADFAVYINNAQEHDGSDAGARPDEAISWGKLTKEVQAVKVYGDAAILFPLLVAKTFAQDRSKGKK